jgi:PAS domain S-box-containing protein
MNVMSTSLRVLYAEDSRIDADLTRAHLALAAPEITLDIVETGEECLARIAQGGSYDVVLLDLHLPDMDGIAVLRDLDTRERPLPVVMVTGLGNEMLAVQALTLGACDYLPKHADYLASLPSVLERAVAEHRTWLAEHHPAARPRRRILYAECNVSDIDLTTVHLRAAAPHLRLDVVRSSADALAVLETAGYDLLLSDLRLPDMNALDLLREVRQRKLPVPVIVITGRGDEAAAVAALRLGAYDYIVKRDEYLTQLPYAIDNAIGRFQLAQVNRRLQTELAERQRSQEATAEALALVDTLQSHAPIGIAFMDRDWRYQRINAALAAINGISVEAHLGRTVAEVLPELWPLVEPLYRRVLAGETLLNVELSLETVAKPGEKRHFVGNFYPVRRPSQEILGIGVFVTEITERKRAEEVLRDHALELAEAAREKDQFLAMLGHELRNPLAPIRTALALLRRNWSDDPVVRRAHTVMDRQITHMVRLLDDLLDVARITNGRISLALEDVDLRQVVREAVEGVRPLIDARRHVLEVSSSPDPVPVHGDVTRLVQVFVNLLNNAAKYTDVGGTIRVNVSADDTHAYVRVVDTGTGISPRLLPKIFDLFTQDDRTLDRAQGGLGLGLTLVRRITELHGGSVEAYSKGRGLGSEFAVHLPLHVPLRRASVPEHPASPVRHSIRCLVVEDNVDAAQMLEFALEAEGHQVHLAYDGRDAVKAAATFKPDAIVLDIGLPRMNGYDAARAIRQLPGLNDVLIIAVTGYGQETDREQSRAAGCDYHFVKPIDLKSLLDVLASGGSAADSHSRAF